MTRAEELRKIVDDARAELDEIETQERFDMNAKSVGRFFRYRNSYSCPASEDEKWWLYTEVTGLTENGRLITTSFQDDKRGRLEIEANRPQSGATLGEPISDTDYYDALDLFREKVAAALKGQKQ